MPYYLYSIVFCLYIILVYECSLPEISNKNLEKGIIKYE